jgi:hypothetical protein
VLIEAVLAHHKIQIIRKDTTPTADSSAAPQRKCYKIDASMTYEEKREIIIKAATGNKNERGIIWFDEVNTAVGDGLEKILNLALTGDDPAGGTKEVHPGFMMISSANSAAMDGRSQISPALQQRSFMVEVKSLKDYSIEDLEKIITSWGVFEEGETYRSSSNGSLYGNALNTAVAKKFLATIQSDDYSHFNLRMLKKWLVVTEDKTQDLINTISSQTFLTESDESFIARKEAEVETAPPQWITIPLTPRSEEASGAWMTIPLIPKSEEASGAKTTAGGAGEPSQAEPPYIATLRTCGTVCDGEVIRDMLFGHKASQLHSTYKFAKFTNGKFLGPILARSNDKSAKDECVFLEHDKSFIDQIKSATINYPLTIIFPFNQYYHWTTLEVVIARTSLGNLSYTITNWDSLKTGAQDTVEGKFPQIHNFVKNITGVGGIQIQQSYIRRASPIQQGDATCAICTAELIARMANAEIGGEFEKTGLRIVDKNREDAADSIMKGEVRILEEKISSVAFCDIEEIGSPTVVGMVRINKEKYMADYGYSDQYSQHSIIEFAVLEAIKGRYLSREDERKSSGEFLAEEKRVFASGDLKALYDSSTSEQKNSETLKALLLQLKSSNSEHHFIVDYEANPGDFGNILGKELVEEPEPAAPPHTAAPEAPKPPNPDEPPPEPLEPIIPTYSAPPPKKDKTELTAEQNGAKRLITLGFAILQKNVLAEYERRCCTKNKIDFAKSFFEEKLQELYTSEEGGGAKYKQFGTIQAPSKDKITECMTTIIVELNGKIKGCQAPSSALTSPALALIPIERSAMTAYLGNNGLSC